MAGAAGEDAWAIAARELELEDALGVGIALVDVEQVRVAPRGELERQGGTDFRGRRGGGVDGELDCEVLQRVGKIEGEPVDGAVLGAGGAGEVFLVGDDDAARAVRGNWIHTGAVVVTGGLFEEAGIDAPALDILEDNAALGFLDGDGFAESAVYVEREADDVLAVEKREGKRALEDAVVGIAKNEVEGGDGESAGDLGVNRGGLDDDRLRGGVGELHALRAERRRGGKHGAERDDESERTGGETERVAPREKASIHSPVGSG